MTITNNIVTRCPINRSKFSNIPKSSFRPPIGHAVQMTTQMQTQSHYGMKNYQQIYDGGRSMKGINSPSTTSPWYEIKTERNANKVWEKVQIEFHLQCTSSSHKNVLACSIIILEAVSYMCAYQRRTSAEDICNGEMLGWSSFLLEHWPLFISPLDTTYVFWRTIWPGTLQEQISGVIITVLWKVMLDNSRRSP